MSQQLIKRRIRSVGSTQQITKAMELVAASKLKRTQEAARGPLEYTNSLQDILGRQLGSDNSQRNPLLTQRKISNALVVVVAGDRGMAGAYNSNILRALAAHTRTINATCSAICIGKYAASHVAKISNLDELAAYDIDTDDADITIAQPVLEEAIELFLSSKIDVVHIIYTRLRSTIKQETTIEQLLPIRPTYTPTSESLIEPDFDTLIDFISRRYLEAQLLQAILQSRASEQAARMLAMMNASDNAKELIEDLMLEYNEQRQSVITQELSEITTGVEALNG